MPHCFHMMMEVYYAIPSLIGGTIYASGSLRFKTDTQFREWLEEILLKGPVLITSIKFL